MRKKREFLPSAIGGSSLLVIFGVLCLTVLALLSFSTVLAEKRLSDSAAEAAAAYYRADTEAEKIFAAIRTGEIAPHVTADGEIYRYTVAVSENMNLEVALQQIGSGWKVLRWQTVPKEQTVDDGLTVWDGT